MSTDLVVILSSDWVDSTATRTRLGEEAADALQELHDSLLRKMVDAEGGQVVKHSGDGVLATFRSASSALAAAVGIQQQFTSYSASSDAVTPIQIRIGLAAGDIKHLSGDIFGRPVVEAVRLQSFAAPGGILCAELVRVLTYGRGSFEFEDNGVLELKGLAPVHAHRVRGPTLLSAPDRTHDGPRPPGADVPLNARADASIAVLPFVNISADPDQGYFSEGLSEELTNQLAQISALRVAGRMSTFSFKGKGADFGDIGKKLGVNYVLEGSVRKAGTRLRITAQLIKCSDGFHLWSERFDRELHDVFAIQDEIAHAVADRLSVTLGVKSASMPGGTENAEALDLLLRARSLVRRRSPGDPERAITLLQRALSIDPKFALAWNVLGNAFTSVLTFGPEDPDAVRRKIDEALTRSVALAPDLWTGHEAHANQLELRHDWVGAEQANARARALAPKSMREPIISRAHQLALVGRLGEAIAFGREAARIEPFAPHPMLTEVLFIAGLHAEAEAERERSKDVAGTRFLEDMFATGRMMALGDHAKARHHLSLCAAEDTHPRSIFREVLAVFDDAAKARTLIRELVETAPRDGRDFSRLLSCIPFASYFGEHELALSAYRHIHKMLLGVHLIHFWHPVHVNMRRLADFKELVRDVGLVTYWRTTGQWGDFAKPAGAEDFECW